MIKIKVNGNKAWVTFTIHPEQAKEVSICGEWNEWQGEPMKMKKNGEYSVTKILPVDAEFQFGYRIDENVWLCDDTTPCVHSPFGSQNSLLKL